MKTEVKKTVREGYAKIARRESSCCAPAGSCGCGSAPPSDTLSEKIGYTTEELKDIPEGANLGLGCGNPVALASLKEGETVLDLGSGAGIDCFLAANKVGSTGHVIGVDMTPEMLDKARENAAKGHYNNVEFRLGEIENLPAADNSVDVIISNCVINLSPDKPRVFQEAHRVLKPGGRLMVSDIVLLKPLPETVKESINALIGCVAGAVLKDKYLAAIKKAGFKSVTVRGETSFSPDYVADNSTAREIVKTLDISMEELKAMAANAVSVKVQALK